MAYGIISIATYLIFLVWVVATYEQGYEGSQLKPFGGGAANLAAAMGQAFSIQSFFIPIIKKAPHPQRYTTYVLIAYVVGSLCYEYIGIAGSIGNPMTTKVSGIGSIAGARRPSLRLRVTSGQAPGR